MSSRRNPTPQDVLNAHTAVLLVLLGRERAGLPRAAVSEITTDADHLGLRLGGGIPRRIVELLVRAGMARTDGQVAVGGRYPATAYALTSLGTEQAHRRAALLVRLVRADKYLAQVAALEADLLADLQAGLDLDLDLEEVEDELNELD